MVGGGHLLADSREDGGDRLWVADERCSPLHFIVCSLLAVGVAVIACGKNRSFTTRREVTKKRWCLAIVFLF